MANLGISSIDLQRMFGKPADLTNDAPRRRTEPAAAPVETRYPADDYEHGRIVVAEGECRRYMIDSEGKAWREDGVRPWHPIVELPFGVARMLRRRTEPAITVPPLGELAWVDPLPGMYVQWKLSNGKVEHGRIVSVEDGCFTTDFGQRVHQSMWRHVEVIDDPEHIDGVTYTVSAIEAFTPTEVEAAKTHGSAAYACMAADIAQARELLAVEEAKAEMEAWRLRNGEWLEYVTDSDGAGEQEQLNRDALEAERVRHEAWLRGLEPPKPGETLGDFAQRAGIDSWYVHSIGGRVHLQWLMDRLARGEVLG